MRTITTLQWSGWSNELSRKGIPSNHYWRRPIKRQVSAHRRGGSTEHRAVATEHSGLLTAAHMKYKQTMMGKETGGKP